MIFFTTITILNYYIFFIYFPSFFGKSNLTHFTTNVMFSGQHFAILAMFSDHFSPMSGTLFFFQSSKTVSALYTPSCNFSEPGFWILTALSKFRPSVGDGATYSPLFPPLGMIMITDLMFF